MGTLNERFDAIILEALAEPIGLLMSTNDFTATRKRIENARARCAIPGAHQLTVRRIGCPEGTLAIVKVERLPLKREGTTPRGLLQTPDATNHS